MKGKGRLVAFLLGVGLYFVPVLGYGEVKEWVEDHKASYMDIILLKAELNYIMRNPTGFLCVDLSYDPSGSYGRKFLSKGVDTKGKICVLVVDNGGHFSHKSGTALLDQFKEALEPIYSFMTVVATDMDTDIVAHFRSEEGIPLGYFYQGEYHLWPN